MKILKFIVTISMVTVSIFSCSRINRNDSTEQPIELFTDITQEDNISNEYDDLDVNNFTIEEISEILEKAESGELSNEESENLQIMLLDRMFKGQMNDDEFGLMIQLMLLDTSETEDD